MGEGHREPCERERAEERFHQLAREHTELVCGMNLAMLAGTVEAAGAAFEARLDPADGRCCVALVPRGMTRPPSAAGRRGDPEG